MKLVFDTYPLIKFFKGEKGADKIQRLLKKTEKGEIKGMISTITLAETFYILGRYKGIEFAKTAIKYVKLNLKSVNVSEKIAKKGGEYKLKYAKNTGMPLADAMIAATSFVRNATLVSDEKHFKKIKKLRFKTSKEILSEIGENN